MHLTFKNNDEICHVWAHQARAEGRYGNLSFRGPVLMSYETPIAKLFPERRLVLLTGVRYSVTTSAHGSCAAGAARHLTVVHLPKRKRVDVLTTLESARSAFEEAIDALATELAGLTRKPSLDIAGY